MYDPPVDLHVRHDVFVHGADDGILREILSIVRTLRTQGSDIMLDLIPLTAAVTATQTAEESAVVLIGQIVTELRSSLNDPAAVAALADQLNNSAAALAAAVVANTPAGPVVPSVDVPPVDVPPADVPPAQ